MGLTWRDLASSAIVLVIFLGYAAQRFGSRLPVLSSASATCGAALVLAAGCAFLAAGDLHTRPQERSGVIFRKITTVAGALGLAAGVLGILTGSWHALEILVAATIVLWMVGTLWHVLSIGSDYQGD